MELHQFWYLYWYQTNTSIFDGIRIGQVYYTSTNSRSVAYALFMYTIMMNFMHQ